MSSIMQSLDSKSSKVRDKLWCEHVTRASLSLLSHHKVRDKLAAVHLFIRSNKVSYGDGVTC